MGNEQGVLRSKSEIGEDEIHRSFPGAGDNGEDDPKPKKKKPNQDDLTRLPKVRQYQPIKVQDTENNDCYAMKFFCLEVKDSYLSEEEQKEMIQSGIKELEILKQFRETRNIIKFKESFVVERSPLNDVSGRHLCLIIEYCRGGNLNNLITDYEKLKKKIKREYVFRWFLDLLSTLNILHSQYNIIHRDLKPDNLLFQLEQEKKVFELDEVLDIKVCDFGVGKCIDKGNMGQQIRGHLFYTAPEVLKPTLSKDVMKSRGYDSRCDIYSLGIIFFQLYKCLSQDRYEKIIVDLQNRMLQKGKKKKKPTEEEEDNINYFELMIRAHRHGVIRELVKQNVRDLGVREVLYKMLSPYEKRSYAKDLLTHPIIKTWINGLDPRRPLIPNPNPLGLLSIFKVFGRPKIFERCLTLLKKIVPSKCSFQKLVELKGIRCILQNLGSQPEKRQPFFFKQYIFKLVLALIQKVPKNYNVTRKIGVYFRRYNILPLYKKQMLKVNRNDHYFLLAMLFHTSQSIIFEMIDCVLQLVPKMDERNGEHISKLLEYCMPYLNKKEVNIVLRGYNYISNFPLRRMPFKNDRRVNEALFARAWFDLSEGMRSKNVPRAGRALELIAYLTFDFGQYRIQKASKMKLMFSCQPTQDCGLEFVIPEQKNRNLVIDPKVSTRYFHYKGGEKKHDCIELMSSEPIGKMTFTRPNEPEMVIGYYEFYVKNAGFNDDLVLGLQDERDQEVLLHCAKGQMTYQNRVFRLGSSVEAVTKVMVGMGVTSKGNVFITKNNDILKVVPTFSPKKDRDIFLFALLKIKKGNKDLKGYVNFGKRMFLYTFANFRKNNKMVVVNSLNEIKGNSDKIKAVQKKFQNQGRIVKLCESLLNFRAFKIEQFPLLIKMYDTVDIKDICKKHKVVLQTFGS